MRYTYDKVQQHNHNLEQLDCYGITLMHHANFEGGGWFAKETFLHYLESQSKKYLHCFDWCSGVGTIGFALYARKLCNALCLGDISATALSIAKKTILNNQLSDVSLVLMDSLANLPKELKFDLIVSNPPHFSSREAIKKTVTRLNLLNKKDFHLSEDDGYRMGVDEDWRAHKDFFANITHFLAPDADILIWENSHGSSLLQFQDMIDEGNLRVINVIPDQVSRFSQCYLLHLRANT